MSAAAGSPSARLGGPRWQRWARCRDAGSSRPAGRRLAARNRACRVAFCAVLVTGGVAGCSAAAEAPVSESDTLVPGPQSADLGARPVIEDLLSDDRGEPPGELVIEDLVTGDGSAIQVGATVTAHFVGATWSSGTEFDATWDRGEAYTFTVGEQRVIEAWDVGLLGAREGTRRVLIAPPQFAYGDAGTATIAAGETLVFIVDIVTVQA